MSGKRRIWSFRIRRLLAVFRLSFKALMYSVATCFKRTATIKRWQPWLVGSLLLTSAPPVHVLAQTVTATVNLPAGSLYVAVNPVTNQVYVPDFKPATCLRKDLEDPNKCLQWLPGWGEITSVNGSTNSPTTIVQPSANFLFPMAVNPVTDRIYAAVYGGNGILVIDGATGAVTTITDSNGCCYRDGIAVNPVANKIYFSNYNTNNVSLMDGATNAITTITDPNAVAPWAIDVNPITNKIYVANNGSANVTVIDGATNAITNNVPVGSAPFAVAVNPITNKIYVANNTSNGTITVIDGATNATTTVPAGGFPFAVGVNPVTNKIYVANDGTNDITVIDGPTNATTTLTDPTASHPRGVAVDALTNQIYVDNEASATVTVIDGASNTLTTVTDPKAQGNAAINTSPIAVNPVTDLVYVSHASQNLTVIAGAAGSGPPDFALAAMSTSLIMQPGAQAADTIVIAPPFGQAIALSCAVTGAAPGPSCDLSTTSVTPGATYATATLTVTAPKAAAMLAPSSQPWLSRFAYAAWLPLAFGIAVVGGTKKQRRWYGTPGALLLVMVLLQTACGGGSSSNNTGGPQGPTNYTVTVTGTAGAIQHMTQVAVTVQ